MRGAYRVLALIIPILVAVQAAAIAVNTFGLFKWVDDENSLTKSVLEGDWDWDGAWGAVLHGVVGMMVIPLIALLLLILSFFAKVPGGIMAALFVFLCTVVQVVLAFVAFGVPEVGALHGLNAFLLFGLAMMAAQKAKATPVVTTGATAAGHPTHV
jgi:hypothetical protein